MRLHLLVLLLATAATVSAQSPAPTPAPAPAPVPADEAPIRADVGFLAADALRGREAGTPDFDVAAQYVVSRMLAAGLRPGAGGGRWLQPVALGIATATDRPTLALVRDGATIPLAFGTEFAAAPIIGPVSAGGRFAIEGRLVFAGFGVVDPVSGRDDYRGLDVRGAVVVMMQARPAGVPLPVAAALGNPAERARQARARGARAVLFVAAPIFAAPADFARAGEAGWRESRMVWLDDRGTPRDEGVPSIGTLGYAGAERLFAGSRLSLPAILAAEKAGTPLPTGPLPGTIRYAAAAQTRALPSSNVVGLLPGTDPKLANEYVVMTAHLDHLGITEGPDGSDRINNGAQDNAVGIALLLDVARRFQAGGTRPRRSILFVALTGEEKGMLGSDYFISHPPVPAAGIVADVNLDMPVLLSPLRDVVAHGGDRSTLGGIVAAATAEVGLSVAPDWEPEQGRFARSDQFSFALHGIPAVSLKAGPTGGSDVKQRAFARTTYHTPADDLTQPIEWRSAPLFARLNYAIVRRIADADTRPAWNPGDWFGERSRRK